MPQSRSNPMMQWELISKSMAGETDDPAAVALETRDATLTLGLNSYRFTCEVRPDGSALLVIREQVRADADSPELIRLTTLADGREWSVVVPTEAEESSLDEAGDAGRRLLLSETRKLFARVRAEVLGEP